MERKWVIVTGGSSGIGLELVKIMIAEGRNVGMIIRNKNREAELLKAAPSLSTYPNLVFFHADISVQKEVYEVAHTIMATWPKVDVLFNNAGVLLENLTFSEQGNEMHYEINTLAPYLLSAFLKPLLLKSEHPLIVNTSTDGLQYIRKINIAALKCPLKFRKLFGPYMYTKLAQYLLYQPVETNLEWEKIKVLFVSPGGNKTKISTGKGMPGWMKLYVKLFYKEPVYGAGLLWKSAFDDNVNFTSGDYIQNGKAVKIPLKIDVESRSAILKGLTVPF